MSAAAGTRIGAPPFAAPLLAVEEMEVAEASGGLLITARKTVRPHDAYMPGHFPDLTIFPGVFLIECLVQAVTLALTERGLSGARLGELRSLRFVAPLLGGDVLTLRANIEDLAARHLVVVEARCVRGDDCEVATMKSFFFLPG
jgi:3-hydroxyacyl-[acyl-carrier-protein] dehydratase